MSPAVAMVTVDDGDGVVSGKEKKKEKRKKEIRMKKMKRTKNEGVDPHFLGLIFLTFMQLNFLPGVTILGGHVAAMESR